MEERGRMGKGAGDFIMGVVGLVWSLEREWREGERETVTVLSLFQTVTLFWTGLDCTLRPLYKSGAPMG